MKNQAAILDKLGIESLNEMQREAQTAIHRHADVVLVSPTGTGKTLAFLLPLIDELQRNTADVQAIVAVPSRELAIQIEQVVREMGTGHKCNAVYGGQSFNKDKINLKHAPAILVGTPGRLADHLRRNTFSTEKITFLVLDEFDKSLEIGFEQEMQEIIRSLPALKKRVLTSATNNIDIPEFVGLRNPVLVDFSAQAESMLELRLVTSPTKDKLLTLAETLKALEGQPGIIFCNFKDSIQQVSDYLNKHNIGHGCFYGGMEQKDRERALIKFRNGSHRLIVATDLAARGLDIPELKFIIHYQLPVHEQEFIHRNGRTARMKSDGTAYILKYEKEKLPAYMDMPPEAVFSDIQSSEKDDWATLLFSAGRKDKVSKGDIAGLCMKQGGIEKEDLGLIELKQDCAFVAVKSHVAAKLVQRINGVRLKTKKLKVATV